MSLKNLFVFGETERKWILMGGKWEEGEVEGGGNIISIYFMRKKKSILNKMKKLLRS